MKADPVNVILTADAKIQFITILTQCHNMCVCVTEKERVRKKPVSLKISLGCVIFVSALGLAAFPTIVICLGKLLH